MAAAERFDLSDPRWVWPENWHWLASLIPGNAEVTGRTRLLVCMYKLLSGCLEDAEQILRDYHNEIAPLPSRNVPKGPPSKEGFTAKLGDVAKFSQLK